ncbi:MAG: hypothetical protein ACREFY_20325 [Acetobacteraceae bacterium]
MSGRAAPVVHLDPRGGLGNRMLQFLAAWRLASLVAGARLSGVALPEWGLVHPALPSGPGATVRLELLDPAAGFAVDLALLAEALNAGVLARVELAHYAQHLGNFPPREVAGTLFPDTAAPLVRCGRETLLISIRGAEIFAAPHPDYTLIPIGFYRELVARTGLAPVFLGQLDPNAYTARLRRAFPRARFIESQGAMADFAMLCHAVNVVPSISTFAWTAAWIGHAERVFLPLSGFLNPAQCPAVDLLPLADPRYRFFLFPINYAVPVAAAPAAHRAMAGTWRLLRPEMLAALRQGRPRFRHDPHAMRAAFDEAFYLERYPDVAAAVALGGYPSGRDHYVHEGFAERREPFRLDRAWYAAAYPLAAVEVGQGDFADFHHHYVAVGAARGYRPLPPAAGSP